MNVRPQRIMVNEGLVRTMKRTAAALAVSGAVLAGGMITAAPADAAVPARAPKAWMTRGEFRWIYTDPDGYGDRLKDVRRNTGSKGKMASEYSWTDGGYCDRYSYYPYTTCAVWKPLKTHYSRTYYWQTSWRLRYGAAVTFVDGHATSKSFYK